MKTIGENLRTIRIELGLTQKEFAEKLGYGCQNISNWEKNRNVPTAHTIKKIHDIFGVEYEDIYDYNLEN